MSANKDKGTSFETSLLPVAREWWPEAHRAPLAGIGDFLLPGNELFTWEAKNWAKLDLGGWTSQAEAQAARVGVPHCIVTHKRRGKTDPYLQWATLPVGRLFEMLYMAEMGVRWRPRRPCERCGCERFRHAPVQGSAEWRCLAQGCLA